MQNFTPAITTLLLLSPNNSRLVENIYQVKNTKKTFYTTYTHVPVSTTPFQLQSDTPDLAF